MTNPLQERQPSTDDQQRFEPTAAEPPKRDPANPAAEETERADSQPTSESVGPVDEPERDSDQADSLVVDAPDDPDRAPSDGQLIPEASRSDPVAALWGADRVSRYRAHWQELQLRFVDDPGAATGEAAGLVDDAVRSLVSSLENQQRGLDGWRSDTSRAAGSDPGADPGFATEPDTEVLRVALRNYRDFLDRLLGM